MATRKISDLTLLTDVSSSDTLLLLDNSDPVDTNKKSLVGSIFTAVPGGTQSAPGLGIELRTSTGLFSDSQGSIGLSLGDAKLLVQKQSTSLILSARDSADANLDLTLQALGTGVIRFGSPITIDDATFNIPNTSDGTKKIAFSAAQIPAGTTRTFVFPDPGATDTLVTLTSIQTLTNKTLVSPTFTGNLSGVSLTLSGNLQVDNNTTLGSSNIDTLTVAATSTFNGNLTLNGTTTSNALTTHNANVRLTTNQLMETYNQVEFYSTSLNNGAGGTTVTLRGDDYDGRYGFSLTYYDLETQSFTGTNKSYAITGSASAYTLPTATVVLNSGVISSITIDTPGSYLPPAVTATITGDGVGAQVTPVIVNGQLQSVTIDDVGANYTTATISFAAVRGGLYYEEIDLSDPFNPASRTTHQVLHTGNLDLVSGLGAINNLVTTGDVTFDSGTFKLDSTNNRVGINRTPTAYDLEVAGDIYFEGGSFIGGNSSNFIVQKRLQSIPLRFQDYQGGLEMIIETDGSVGIGKLPTQKLDVAGNARIDGDLNVAETDPVNSVGGSITAKRINLTDLDNNTQVITAEQVTSGSRNKIYFHAYS